MIPYVDATSHNARLSDGVVRSLVSANAGAAAMLLAALLVTAIWQDAAVDFVTQIAVALGLHGCGLLAGVCAYAFRYLRAQAQPAGAAARAFRYFAVFACAASAACFASGLAVVVWGALTVLGADYDPQSNSVPLHWLRS
jgi:hypothetical protein